MSEPHDRFRVVFKERDALRGALRKFIIAALLAFSFAFTGCELEEPASDSGASVQEEVQEAVETATEGAKSKVDDARKKVKKAKKSKPKRTETVAQENARKSAESYLNSSAFSRKGLIGQLEYEGFSKADARYAVRNIKVNWKKQAAKSAEAYLDSSAFSRSGLIEQLKYEGFSAEQAEYGVNSVGL